MQFQSYKIADLIPASYNPRKKLKPGDKEYEKIKNSIKEFGYVEPIIINSDMTIIGGHQRATVTCRPRIHGSGMYRGRYRQDQGEGTQCCPQ